MADEDLTPTEGEVIDTPVEDAAPEPVEQAEANPVEALASELGWAPKERFKGDPERWKPADEFIRAGRDIQRGLSRDLQDLRGTVDTMSRTSAALLEQQLAAQRAELESRFDAAVENGDGQAARQAREQIDRIEQARPVSPQAPDPAGRSFVERHASWWGKDTEATNYALQRADHYAKMGIAGDRQTKAVEQDMRGIFPDLFPAPAKAPPSVSAPPSRTAAPASRAKGFHDLPQEAQRVARDMKERGVIPDVDAYVKNYFAEKAR